MIASSSLSRACFLARASPVNVVDSLTASKSIFLLTALKTIIITYFFFPKIAYDRDNF